MLTRAGSAAVRRNCLPHSTTERADPRYRGVAACFSGGSAGGSDRESASSARRGRAPSSAASPAAGAHIFPNHPTRLYGNAPAGRPLRLPAIRPPPGLRGGRRAVARARDRRQQPDLRIARRLRLPSVPVSGSRSARRDRRDVPEGVVRDDLRRSAVAGPNTPTSAQRDRSRTSARSTWATATSPAATCPSACSPRSSSMTSSRSSA